MSNTTRHLSLLLLVLCCSTLFIAPSTFAQTADEATADMPGRVRLVLPPALYAVPNVETNIYFDNVILTTNVHNYAFDVQCTRGVQQAERWTYTPTPEDVGQYELTLEVRDEQNALVARASTLLHVVPADAGAGRDIAVLFIGDSLTHASVYPQQVYDHCQNEGNPKLTLIGSHQPGSTEGGPIRHEGYGGWTAERFVTHYADIARTGYYRERGSPFLYKANENAAPTLDFARYCNDVADGRRPDIVTIFLGPNDIFHATDDTIEATIDNMLSHMQTLIDMILTDSPTTHIGVLLPVPPRRYTGPVRRQLQNWPDPLAVSPQPASPC